jgi:hypothetical protein
MVRYDLNMKTQMNQTKMTGMLIATVALTACENLPVQSSSEADKDLLGRVQFTLNARNKDSGAVAAIQDALVVVNNLEFKICDSEKWVKVPVQNEVLDLIRENDQVVGRGRISNAKICEMRIGLKESEVDVKVDDRYGRCGSVSHRNREHHFSHHHCNKGNHHEQDYHFEEQEDLARMRMPSASQSGLKVKLDRPIEISERHFHRVRINLDLPQE